MYKLIITILMAVGIFSGAVPALAVSEQPIYEFNGSLPSAALLVMPDGASYGVITGQSGLLGDWGEVFKLDPPNANFSYWRKSTIYKFKGNEDGFAPMGKLVAGPNGSLYGTTTAGGFSFDPSCAPYAGGCGTVFQLLPPASAGASWTKVILKNFDSINGFPPLPRDLNEDASGRLYGILGSSLAPEAPVGSIVYQLAAQGPAGGHWTYTPLYVFSPGIAANPDLLIEPDGVIYGTTTDGGPYISGNTYAIGFGNVFSLTPPPPGYRLWTYADLYDFRGGESDGATPNGGLLGGEGVDSPGIHLWGTTQNGGAYGQGTLFQVSQPNLSVQFGDTILHDFSGESDGGVPKAGFFEADDGSYWGTASRGGSQNCSGGCGVIFKMARQNDFTHVIYTFSVAASFNGYPSDGSYPITTLAADNHGSLYGMTRYGGPYGNIGTGTAFTLADAVPVYAADEPVIEPEAGGYTTAQAITITDLTPGTTIFYTTDGTNPKTSSPVYTGPLTVECCGTHTIKALAAAPGYLDSHVVSATYTIAPRTPEPAFSPAGGTYTGTQKVSLTEAGKFAGVPIYYTIDGATPTTSSPKYTGPISVSSTKTIKAIALAAGYLESDVASATYTIR